MSRDTRNVYEIEILRRCDRVLHQVSAIYSRGTVAALESVRRTRQVDEDNIVNGIDTVRTLTQERPVGVQCFINRGKVGINERDERFEVFTFVNEKRRRQEAGESIL